MSAATIPPPVADPFAGNEEESQDSTYITMDTTGDEPTVVITPDDDAPLPERDGPKLTAEQMAERTEEYPWGRRADGTPRKRPGPPPSGKPKQARAIPRISTGKRKTTKPRQTSGTDYTAGIAGLLQIPAAILGGMGIRDKAFALDGAAIAQHAPGIADALNDLAQDNLAVAAALDKILAVGPYGAILGAVLPLVAQIAANHKLLPDQVTTGMGAMPVDQYEAALIASMPT